MQRDSWEMARQCGIDHDSHDKSKSHSLPLNFKVPYRKGKYRGVYKTGARSAFLTYGVIWRELYFISIITLTINIMWIIDLWLRIVGFVSVMPCGFHPKASNHNPKQYHRSGGVIKSAVFWRFRSILKPHHNLQPFPHPETSWSHKVENHPQNLWNILMEK